VHEEHEMDHWGGPVGAPVMFFMGAMAEKILFSAGEPGHD
jgi:hypothetical protein